MSATTLAASADAKADSIEVLEHELGQLARVLEAMQRKRNYPLDRAQYLLLRVLETQGPTSTTALAGLMLLDDSTVTRQLAAMETADLIGRKPNPNDKRSSLVHATRHGLSIARKMRRMRLDRIARLVESWPDGDRDQLAALLVKLNDGLKRSLCEA